eukprot:5296455-Prorocentrum_lima.AAC.1
MTSSLVGSEMCIRDRARARPPAHHRARLRNNPFAPLDSDSEGTDICQEQVGTAAVGWQQQSRRRHQCQRQ